jgi:hypothetical protein
VSAWDDLDEAGMAYHWLEATADTIAEIVLTRIRTFLAEAVP